MVQGFGFRDSDQPRAVCVCVRESVCVVLCCAYVRDSDQPRAEDVEGLGRDGRGQEHSRRRLLGLDVAHPEREHVVGPRDLTPPNRKPR